MTIYKGPRTLRLVRKGCQKNAPAVMIIMAIRTYASSSLAEIETRIS